MEIGEKEALILIDLPKVHELPSSLCVKARELGIQIYSFPHNSTSWSRMCDNQFCFGVFKVAYYTLLEAQLTKRARAGDSSGTIRAADIPKLVRLAWSRAITAKCTMRAFLACGIIPGHSETLKSMRHNAQRICMLKAPELTPPLTHEVRMIIQTSQLNMLS